MQPTNVSVSVSAAIVLVLAVLITVPQGLHTVSEGHVAVYWRAGKLLWHLGDPGLNLMVPFIDRMEEVQVTMQTDRVSNIPCGTSGGVIIEFSQIEVVNRLNKAFALEIIQKYGVNYDKLWIFDKIHHEINQFCSSHTLQEVYVDMFSTLDESLVKALQADIDIYARGIDIIAVRVTKPKIPHTILDNYIQMESEKTKLLVAVQQAKVERQKAETEKMKAEIKAQQDAAVGLIEKERMVKEKEVERKLEQQIAETQKMKAEIKAQTEATVSIIEKERNMKEAEMEQKISMVRDEMLAHRQKVSADAEYYAKMKEAEANKLLFTPEFLQHSFSKAVAANAKIYFGPSIPSILLDSIPNFSDKAK